MNASPMVSVLLSVYNGRSYIRESAASILGQTLKELELVIVDDGSNDGTADLVDQIAGEDDRVKVIHQQNAGLTVSLNRAAKAACAPVLARQDADDRSRPQRLEKQLPWVTKHGFALCCSRTWLVEQERASPRITSPLVKGFELMWKNPFVHGSFMIRRDAFEKLGGYDEQCRVAQDADLVVRLAEQGMQIKYLADVLYETRNTAGGIGRTRASEQRAVLARSTSRWRRAVMNSPLLVWRLCR